MKKEMDPLVAGSNVYKLLNANDRGRVLQVASQPDDVAKTLHHPDHVVYTVKRRQGDVNFWRQDSRNGTENWLGDFPRGARPRN